MPNVSRKKQKERKERNIMRKTGSQGGKSPSRMIDERIKELGDWRGKMLSQLRALITQADPEVVEEWKWRGVPVWSHDGLKRPDGSSSAAPLEKVIFTTFLYVSPVQITTPASMATPGVP